MTLPEIIIAINTVIVLIFSILFVIGWLSIESKTRDLEAEDKEQAEYLEKYLKRKEEK